MLLVFYLLVSLDGPFMGMAEIRIEHDISHLVLPVELVRDGQLVYFTIYIETHPYCGTFSFQLTFPSEYPFASPKLKCLTKTFHPNIDEDGNVCLKILREGWMPSYDLNSIIVSLHTVFMEPSSEDALNTTAGDLLEFDRDEFIRQAEQVNEKAQAEQKCKLNMPS